MSFNQNLQSKIGFFPTLMLSIENTFENTEPISLSLGSFLTNFASFYVNLLIFCVLLKKSNGKRNKKLKGFHPADG
jgi:hypothetical protein